jgi:aryl-alcohol dehydrogenase-like predicted oxidoreductase
VEERALGRHGPSISVVGYGGYEAGGKEWGPNPSDRQVIDAIRAGIDAGMTWVDTAEVYGQGRSEELVGRALDGRDGVLVFTKVAPDEEGTGVRPDEVRRALHASLRRLRRDAVDLYQVHWPDERIPIEDTWGAMSELVGEGLARFIGLSNVGREEVERCLPIHHVQSVQNELSLLDCRDLALPPWLSERGVGYLAYAPLASGLLTGAIDAQTTFAGDDWRSGKRPPEEEYGDMFEPANLGRNLARVDALRPVARRLGLPLAVVALRWLLERDGVTAAIAGSRNADHVRQNAGAGSITLDAATVEELERLAA